MSPEEYSYSFLLWPKMMTATSTEHSTDSSCAFLNKPPLRLRKVTDLCGRSQYDGARGSGRGRVSATHAPVAVVLDGLDLDLAAAHCARGCVSKARVYIDSGVVLECKETAGWACLTLAGRVLVSSW